MGLTSKELLAIERLKEIIVNESPITYQDFERIPKWLLQVRDIPDVWPDCIMLGCPNKTESYEPFMHYCSEHNPSRRFDNGSERKT